eukprot:m.56376 g.56376  ORF g.56376 m.56376 type:complete len:2661 (+) comp11036_c1_seq1:86-8068(+)
MELLDDVDAVATAAEGSLHYGDYVSFFATEVKGFISNNISSPTHATLRAVSGASINKPKVKEFQECVFQLLAPNKYKARRRLRKHLEELMLKGDEEGNALKEEEILATAGNYEQLPALIEAAEVENADNKLEQERRHGDELLYGQGIQLRHVHSGRWVHVSTTATSKLEPSNMRVILDENDSRTAWLKIAPRFKVRADGDPIRNQDQVKIESLETLGQYLHTSVDAQKKIGLPLEHAENEVHEINASVQASSYTVRLYRTHQDETELEGHTSIDGGDIVQLFHKETGSYMAAEGSFTERQSLEGLVEDVHLRIRAPDPGRPSRKEPPTSAVSFFVLERDTATLGEPVKWQNRIRFKHVPTQLYLSIDYAEDEFSGFSDGDQTQQVAQRKQSTVKKTLRRGTNTTSEDFRYNAKLVSVVDESTVFKLHPVIADEGELVIDDTYTRIQHAESGFWLSAMANKPFKRNIGINPHAAQNGKPGLPEEFTPLIDAVQNVKWDGADLIHIGFSARPQFDDAFIINRVLDEQCRNVNFVKGIIPVLRQYLVDRMQPRHVSLQYASVMVHALKSLQKFMYHKGQPQKKRQKLLRDFKVTELIVEILRSNFDRFNKASGVSLQKLTEKNPVNDAVMMVCNAASDVLDAYLDGDSRKNELYMARHLPYFQYLFGSEIKMEEMYTELVRDNLQLVQSIGEREVRKVVDLIGKDKNPDFLAFLCVLCECDDDAMADNQELVARILLEEHKGLVYLTEVNEQKTGVVVSVDNQRTWVPLDKFASSGKKELWKNREYKFLEQQLDLFGQLCLGRNEYCIEMITQKLHYLTWEECFLCAKSEKLPNMLRAKYVELIRNLFVDVGKNVDVLAEIRLDFPWNELTPEPYHDAADDRTQSLSGAYLEIFPELSQWIASQLQKNGTMIAHDKANNLLLTEILELLYMLICFGFYVHPNDIKQTVEPLTSMLNGFNDLETRGGSVGFASHDDHQREDAVAKWRATKRYEDNEYNHLVMTAKNTALNCVNAIFNLITTIRIQLLMWDFKMISAEQDGLNRHQSVSKKMKGHHHSSHIMQLLRKLASHRGEDFDDMWGFVHGSREYVRSIVAKSNYITPGWFVADGCRHHHDKSLPEVLLDLGRYESSKLLLASFELLQRMYTATDNMFHYAVDAQVLIQQESLDLAHYLHVEMPLLRRIAHRPLVHDDAQELVSMFEKLANACTLPNDRAEGAHTMNQNIITNGRTHLVILEMIGRRHDLPADVLRSMFLLLRKLAHGNVRMQNLLFHNLDVIIDTIGSSHGWEDEMGKCIEEIFNACRDTCVHVGERHIEKMIEIVAEHQKEVPSMLDALAAVIKLEDVNIPLKRNQDLIIKSLMKHRDSVISVAYIDDQSDPKINALRTDLLRGDGTINDKTDRKLLAYHLSLVSLLASCAEGENEFIESVLQTVFTVPEVIDVLCDDKILATRKSSYLRFLLWVYLNTGAGPSIENGTIHLKTDDNLFLAMENIAQRKLVPLAQQADEVSQDDLEYAFDAYFPTLSVIIKSFYAPNEFPASEDRLKRTTGYLVQFCQKALPKVYNRVWIKTVSSTIINIDSRIPSAVPKSFLDSIFAKLQSSEADIVHSPAEEAYRVKYKRELELNENLNLFVTNLEQTYHGKNDVDTQMHHVAKTRHLSHKNREDEYCEGPEEDETLPLGEYFQHFVEIFSEIPRAGPPTVHIEDIEIVVRQFKAASNLGNTLSPEKLERQYKVTANLLQAVRAILHNINVAYEEDDELDAIIHDVQNRISETGIVLPVMEFLNSASEDVSREAVALLCAVLDGGNKVAQSELERYFLNTREETFFQDVINRLTMAKNSMLQNRLLKRQMEEEMERAKSMVGTMTMISSARIDKDLLKESRDDQKTKEKEVPQAPEISIKDEGNIELTFRLLQLMCEGHNVVIKSYLHEQPDNMRSLDLVTETVTFLDMAIQEIDKDNIHLLIQSFETLVEFCQGNFKNQSAVFDAHCMDSVNRVLRTYDFGEGITTGTVYHLKQTAALLVLAMMEDNTDTTKKMAQELEDTLDIKEVLHTLTCLLEDSRDHQKVEEVEEEEEMPAAADVGYDWYSVLARLSDFTGNRYSEMSQYNMIEEMNGNVLDEALGAFKGFAGIKKPKHAAFDNFEKKDCTIEILRDGAILKLHFPGARWKPYLRSEVKDALQWKVDRTSPGDKIRSFVAETKTIIADILYEKRQVDSSAIARFLIRGSSNWRDLLLFLSFLINIIMLSSWSARTDYNDVTPDTFASYDSLLYILGTFHLIAALLVCLAHWVVTPPSFVPVIESVPYLPQTLTALSLYKSPEGHAANRTRISVLSPSNLYYMGLVIFSILGLFTSGYLYSLHLLHIVDGNDTLQRVVQAVTKNGKSLLWVALLMIIVIYQYSLWAFAFYRKSFDPMEGAYCETEFQCFITSIRLGMMSGGGLGEALPIPEIYNFRGPGVRTIFDLSFFIIITTIGMNVVFGIIVDTFSELRDEKYAVEEAMKSECFICSIKAYEFEKNGTGFDNHIRKEHNIWNYIYFLLHLDEKDPTDYNSNENYIYQRLVVEDQYDIFPVNKALALTNTDSEEDQFHDRVLTLLENQASRLSAIEGRLDKELQEREERREQEARAARAQAPLERSDTMRLDKSAAASRDDDVSGGGFSSGDDNANGGMML